MDIYMRSDIKETWTSTWRNVVVSSWGILSSTWGNYISHLLPPSHSAYLNFGILPSLDASLIPSRIYSLVISKIGGIRRYIWYSLWRFFLPIQYLSQFRVGFDPTTLGFTSDALATQLVWYKDDSVSSPLLRIEKKPKWWVGSNL